jgi:folate-binding protein YgfZ
MPPLPLHEFHQCLDARFAEVNGTEVVAHYGDPLAEHAAWRASAVVLDLSFRSRLCLLGADRHKFLHGQVTNEVNDLQVGEGRYAFLVNAKGRIQSDLNIYRLADELLLDFEPGFAPAVSARLEKYIIADDVQIVDAAPHYGLLSVQGPRSGEVVAALNLGVPLPSNSHQFATVEDTGWGQIYLANQSRAGFPGFDLFVPVAALGMVADKLLAAAKSVGGRAAGWEASEMARIEAGIPRHGVDMDETNLAPETGQEARAISYTKGCYIGQEVIARVRTYGQVAKALRGLRFPDDLTALPQKGDKLQATGKEAGYVTSSTRSPALKANIALAYVRREFNHPGTVLTLNAGAGTSEARVVSLPFNA